MVDLLADAEGISVNTVNFKALFGRGLIGHVPVMLAKSQTLMDASDESVVTVGTMGNKSFSLCYLYRLKDVFTT
ncbi:hypothetical protein YC2023_101076 [Brassica napus]